jgi:hypothetical protein
LRQNVVTLVNFFFKRSAHTFCTVLKWFKKIPLFCASPRNVKHFQHGNNGQVSQFSFLSPDTIFIFPLQKCTQSLDAVKCIIRGEKGS